MTLKIDTMYNIGETVYFLDLDNAIAKGVVTKIDSRIITYKDSYTGELKDYRKTEYVIHSDYPDDLYRDEEKLFTSPEDIVEMYKKQIEQGDFDNLN